jgi:hypothetical protein
MHSVLDGILVGGVLFASVVYAVLSLGPRTLRARLLVGASVLLRRMPAHPRLHALAARLQSWASRRAKGACGGCDNCGSEKSPAVPSSRSEFRSEFRIGVSQIGKRAAFRGEDAPANNTSSPH